MSDTVGPDGEIRIPAALCKELGIEPGAEIDVWRQGDHLALRPSEPRPPLRGRFRGAALSDVLLAERSADLEREERKWR
jgi:antitoxin component of MazEF toxin-antitoxin module